jgi:hypothetical protein
MGYYSYSYSVSSRLVSPATMRGYDWAEVLCNYMMNMTPASTAKGDKVN